MRYTSITPNSSARSSLMLEGTGQASPRAITLPPFLVAHGFAPLSSSSPDVASGLFFYGRAAVEPAIGSSRSPARDGRRVHPLNG